MLAIHLILTEEGLSLFCPVLESLFFALLRKDVYVPALVNVFGPDWFAVFSPGNDGEAGDVGSIVDAAGSSQVKKGPLEARLGFLTEPNENDPL